MIFANRILALMHRISVAEQCEHEWEYMERRPGETYTGYCEKCRKCHEIVQVPQ